MAMVFKYGLMELSMKDNGITIKQKVKVHFGMLKVMCMKVSLKMTKLTAMEFIHTLMVLDMKDFGKMICKRDMVVKYGLIVLNIQVPIERGRNIVMEFMNG
jgi:hypothetical protein